MGGGNVRAWTKKEFVLSRYKRGTPDTNPVMDLYHLGIDLGPLGYKSSVEVASDKPRLTIQSGRRRAQAYHGDGGLVTLWGESRSFVEEVYEDVLRLGLVEKEKTRRKA